MAQVHEATVDEPRGPQADIALAQSDVPPHDGQVKA
jgi:hypothetical protein